MGSGGYKTKDWDNFSTSRAYHDPKTRTRDIYRGSSVHDDLNPLKFDIRESVDSGDNPKSTPLIIGLDVTGSMRPVLDSIARKGLKTVCEGVYERKPITDPHICVLGIGDVNYDRGPFQATQFEADIRIFEQLEKIWLEGGGGGNDSESYILAWYFAKFRTKCDSFIRRGVKGTIFTVGDEEITPTIDASHLAQFMGDTQTRAHSARELYDLVYPEWNVFHVIIKEGSHASRAYDAVYNSWADVIGAQRVIPIDDHHNLGEIIVSTLEVITGKTVEEVANTWDGSTAIEVKSALKQITVGSGNETKSLDSVL